ncbi:BTAD domain-containing putative transcriptional regulator [Streptomyces sp. NPDC046727]|uniref:AfsR/SARP family transcriptional regulator n=1 Tax=Streptomyces sp. NPDC046727 TaxID=3155373 RepID=UPI003411B457
MAAKFLNQAENDPSPAAGDATIFRILGETSVATAEAGAVAIHGKKAELLSFLLLNANKVIPVDQIVETLWDDEPPKSAIRNVRTYVWQIRRVLGTQAHRLNQVAGGYVFHCDPEELDVSRFEELRLAGYQSLEAADSETAAEKFREALALWRGDVLNGVRLSHRLQAVTDWLRDRRLGVFESLMEADLALGRHQDVAEHASREVINHPFRERLYEVAMRAQLGLGRPSEALAVYRKAQQVFAKELGIRPGAALDDIYRQIVRGRPGDSPATQP